MDAVICCIAKHEGQYIREWIEYHLKLGFAWVYIYDNSHNNEYQCLEKEYEGYVHVLHFPGKAKQMPAYNHFLQQFGPHHHWVAFIDVDEFIVLREHDNITDFLSEHCVRGSVALNWLYFGSNGQDTNDGRPVLERFTRCDHTVAKYVKVIARIDDVVSVPEPHYVKLKSGTHQRFMDGKTSHGQSMYLPTTPRLKAVLHHYFTKSKEEFRAKASRDRACDSLRYGMEWFTRHDVNRIENIDALIFFRTHALPPIPRNSDLRNVVTHE